MQSLLRLFKRKNSNPHILAVVMAIVLFWRGIWGLLDLYLFPDNRTVSSLISLFLGLSILLLIDNSKLDELE